VNLSNIRFNVAGNLGDADMIQHSPSSINSSIQEAYRFVCAKTLCLEKSFKFPQIGNQVYYDFLTYHHDLLIVSAIWNLTTNRWLIPGSRKMFDEWRWDWELMEGEPQWFDPINYRYTAIIPHNSVQSGSGFQVFYKAKAEDLTDDSILSIPSTAIKCVENYATADQFFIDREFARGIRYYKQFLEDIPVIKKLALRKADADRINIAAPNDALPVFSNEGDFVWIENETPAGTIDGTNTIFTLAATPNPTSTLMLFLNGVLMVQGTNYTLNDNIITFASGSIPQVNDPVDTLVTWYQV
jgi:hypothetical protein